ncbi:MAG: hypothetical protein B7Z82_00720 [Halothiobacillus sp. 20-54-6]|nr:MAG: hypothetical protein B7Z82_00720 [Halothiobacillus sp. 20-54-6]
MITCTHRQPLETGHVHGMNKRLIRPNFSRNIWLIFVLYGLLAAAFVVYVDAEKTIGQANDQRLQSLQLTDELRQASNDLTRMARAYTITGKPVFKKIYQEILAIRDGQIPRPINHGDMFWDLFLGDEPEKSRAKSQEISAPLPPAALLDRMRAAQFTPQELNLLTQSKQKSDALTALEYRAMAMIDQGANTDPSLKLRAIELLQNPAYYHAKARIMRPIHEATELILARTTQRVQTAEQTALQLRWVFIALGIALILLWLRTYYILARLLGGNLDSVYHTISQIGQGDFKTTIPINTAQKNSVLDWLSQTQNRLAALDETRQAHETKINRMTRLYAALSQCNQAIVRCTNREELFAQICLDAVRFGGMKMAWIGEVEPETGQVRVVSAYGAGIEYLEGIDISLDPNKPSGQGPTGIALRTDTAYWCQDFIHDPRVAAWHERGAQVGWKSSAALPLHRDAHVVGVFSLYSNECNAFDEPVQNLLTEMAMDISFALHNFARETARAKTEAQRTAILARLEKITSHVPGMVYEFRLNPDGSSCFPFASTGTRNIYHLEPAQLEHDAALAFDRIHPDDLPRVRASIQKSAASLAPWRHEYRVANPNGATQWLLGQSLPEREPDGGTLWTGFITDITQQKETEARIAQLAHFDALTGLPNRILLLEHVDYALVSAQRDTTSLSLMFIDLDHFKNVNDALGHAIGDELLVSAANRFLGLIRPQDTLSRQGGDEFTLIIPECNADSATRMANRLIEQFNQPFVIGHHELNITLSIGIAVYPDDGGDFDSLSKHADIALYRAKESGRNDFRFFTTEMQIHSDRVM